ncbi:cupredoxin family copper-binding protein [Chloroflexota bacterium]
MKIYFGNTSKHQNMLNIIILALALIFAMALAVSCQSKAPAPAPYVPSEGTPLAPTTEGPEQPTTPLQIEVTINGLAFNPSVYTVPVGAIVVWYNNDSVTHTITARDNSFDSGNLSPGEPGDTFQYTFEQSGVFEYYCEIHPSMVGKIIVE